MINLVKFKFLCYNNYNLATGQGEPRQVRKEATVSLPSRVQGSNMKVITLVSSGFDSVSLLNYYINKSYDLYPLYVKAGFKWEQAEIEHLEDIIAYISSFYKNINSLKI